MVQCPTKAKVGGLNPSSRTICYISGLMHPTVKGDISTLRVAVALMERGDVVLRPMSENTRYDLAIATGAGFARVQCKSGRLRNGVVKFNVVSQPAGGQRRKYAGQIELFGVYCADLNSVYLVPVDRISSGATVGFLRVSAPKNQWKSKILWARDFQIAGPTT